MLKSTGLELWFTEITANSTDLNENSGVYNDLLRMAFSFPEVKGIIMWTAHDSLGNNPNAALWTGDDMAVSE